MPVRLGMVGTFYPRVSYDGAQRWSEPPEVFIPMPTPGATIAVVDDDDAMRRSIQRVLKGHGYATEAFADAEAFLDSGIATRINGVVLDIHLPGMSGLDLQRRLRASGSTLPVIFITAYDEPATRADALAVGCVAYLTKPFDASDLADSLKRAVTA